MRLWRPNLSRSFDDCWFPVANIYEVTWSPRCNPVCNIWLIAEDVVLPVISDFQLDDSFGFTCKAITWLQIYMQRNMTWRAVVVSWCFLCEIQRNMGGRPLPGVSTTTELIHGDQKRFRGGWPFLGGFLISNIWDLTCFRFLHAK